MILSLRDFKFFFLNFKFELYTIVFKNAQRSLT